LNQESFTKARWGKAKSFKLRLLSGPQCAIQQLAEGGAGGGPDKEEFGRKISWVVQTASAARVRCGKFGCVWPGCR